MTCTNPIEELQQEHRVIQQVIGRLPALVEKPEAAEPVPTEIVADITEFLQTFAGDCHHAKEEMHLFRLL